MKKRILSLILVLALMLSLLPLGASACCTLPGYGARAPGGLVGTYSANGIIRERDEHHRPFNAVVSISFYDLDFYYSGSSLHFQLEKESLDNRYYYSLDGKTCLTLSDHDPFITLNMTSKDLGFTCSLKKDSPYPIPTVSQSIFRSTVKAVTCATATTVKLASCLTKNIINGKINLLGGLLG